MALRYEMGFQTVAAATGAAYCSFNAPTRNAHITEIGISNNAATASSIGLCRGANAIVQTSTTLGNGLDTGDAAATCTYATTWSTAPTTPATYLRRIVLPATAGAGVIWTFRDEGCIVGQGSAAANFLVLWNFGAATGSILNVWISYQE